MKTLLKHCVVIIPLSLLSLVLHAQDSPMKWGEVSREDLAMTAFPADTNASAVVLCDFGRSSFSDDMELVFHREQRVKILSTRGYDWGTKSIVVLEEDDAERVDEIEGITYTLGKDGEIVKKELDSDDIFKEKLQSGLYRYRFTMPGLTPGCIIDIRYNIYAKSIYDIRDWVFQWSEPVRWSEYRVIMPKSLAYVAVRQGFERFAVNEDHEVNQIYSGQASAYLGRNPVHSREWRWAVSNVPAVRPEPYSTTTDDYVNKVDIQLAGYTFVGMGAIHVLSTWQKVVDELCDSKYFGDRIEETGDVEDQVELLTKNLTDPKEKMKAIYNWVANSIVWNESYRRSAEQDVDDVLESKKGNEAEITFLLISMLRSAGITADPVILSTRPNGKVQDYYPIVSQFNYVMTRAVIGSSVYYLDATDPMRPYDLLPTDVLNVKGLVVHEGRVEWAPIESRDRSTRTYFSRITLAEDGSISGSAGASYANYAALGVRKALKGKEAVDAVKEEWKVEPMGIVVDSASVEGKDSLSGPVVLKAWISSDTYAQKAGDKIYLNPLLLGRTTENPFKLQVRKYPVDYSYPRTEICVTTIVLPDSFQLMERFGNRAFGVGSEDVTYHRQVQVDGNTIQIRTTFKVNKVEIPPERYQRLKEFYAAVLAVESEQLVLEKKQPPPPPTAKTKKQTAVKVKGKAKR